MRYGCKLVIFIHRKSHTGFPLVPKMATLNGVMAVILRYFTEFGSCGANCVKTVEVRAIGLLSGQNLVSTIYDSWSNSHRLLRNRYHLLESETSTCGTPRGQRSSRALVIFVKIRKL